MTDDLVKKFVELHNQTEQLLNQDKIKDAKQKYLEVMDVYHAIHNSPLERFHKELAYDQVTTLFKKVNAAKQRVQVPYHLIAAGMLVIAFSFLLFLNPNIVGLASFEDQIRQPVDITFTESRVHQVTLRDRPLTLAASGTYTGNVKLYFKQGEKLELIFDSETSPSENGKFNDICEETCELVAQSNVIELFAQIEDGSISVTELSYKVERSDNSAPAWKGKTRTFDAQLNKPTTLDLTDYFEDPDGDNLVFLSTTAEGIDITVKNNKVTLVSKQTGTKKVTLIASDLLEITKIPVTIEVK